MINVHTTDILKPITGEVEKPATTDHGESVEVSFQSIIAAEDTDTAALITVSNQPLAPETHPNLKIDHVSLAAASPAFFTVFDSAPDPVLVTQSGQPLVSSQFGQSPNPPILLATAIGGDSGDAGQIASITPPDSKDTRHSELGVAQRHIASGPVIGKEGAAIVLRPAATKPMPLETNMLGQAPIDMPIPAQYSSAGSGVQTNTNSTVSAKQSAPIAAPTIAVLPDIALPKKPTDPNKGSLPVADPPIAGATSQEKPAFTLQMPVAPQSQSGPIEPPIVKSQSAIIIPVGDRAIAPKSAPAPIQAAAQRPTQMPTVDMPATQADFVAAASVQVSAFKTGAMQPDLVRTSTFQPSQTPPEAATKHTIPQKKIQVPALGYQSQAKQPQSQPAGAATLQPPPTGVTPQATLSPTDEKHIVKPDNPPTSEPQTRALSKNNSTQTTIVSDVEPTVPLSETTKAGTVEPLSDPEFVPFDVKSADSLTNLRQDANINRPEVMRHVAQQLAEVARRMPDRPIELALNPEELGRVRLTFTTTDGGIHIAVMAERGETMDLLRRHIETLAQEFRELGYKDVNFEFSQNGQNDAQNGEADAHSNADPDAAPAQTQSLAPVQLSLEPSTGLDLRL